MLDHDGLADVRWKYPVDPKAWSRYAWGGRLSWGRISRRQSCRRFGLIVGWHVFEVEVFGRFVGIYL